MELPEPKKLEERPEKMPYPKNKIRFPFYGAALENMIRYAVEQKDGKEKEIMTGMIANHMKKSYLLFNKHSVSNDTIILHLKQLSNDKKLKDDINLLVNQASRCSSILKDIALRKQQDEFIYNVSPKELINEIVFSIENKSNKEIK